MQELLKIDHEEVTVILKGKLEAQKLLPNAEPVTMEFFSNVAPEKVLIYDQQHAQLTGYHEQMVPIFFENGLYELIILPKSSHDFTFYHEFEGFRKAVTKLSHSTPISTGTLLFRNEVGYSQLEIHKNGKPFIQFTIEVFPTKLDYQKDYKELINQVNEEVYNLAYSFLNRTFLPASKKQFKDPSLAEFYRILKEHVDEYLRALSHIERFPHHQLTKTYEEVRGDRLRKQDSRGRAYLRKNAQLFVAAERGIHINGRQLLPQKGLLIRKQQSFDTHENRYVKWTMQRIRARVHQLQKEIIKSAKQWNNKPDAELLDYLKGIEQTLSTHLQKPLWQQIGQLDRSVYSLVMQMATGYRETFQIYTMLSQSLILQGELYKMSVKNIATLYEYWTFLKLGKILSEQLEKGEQTVVQVNRNGLFVNLNQNSSAIRKFKHPHTQEEIELRYQYHSQNLPTVKQIPDAMLKISKRGKSHQYHYIFDAKYRVDIEKGGPREDDINTMHRYRDALVAEHSEGYYERIAFGAYVLFPWNDEESYRTSWYYKSIEKVNIGGLPFLPNQTKLVEEILHSLIHKSAEELQRQGILPAGTEAYIYNEKQPQQRILAAEETATFEESSEI